jgi:hypothetical protein
MYFSANEMAFVVWSTFPHRNLHASAVDTLLRMDFRYPSDLHLGCQFLDPSPRLNHDESDCIRLSQGIDISFGKLSLNQLAST